MIPAVGKHRASGGDPYFSSVVLLLHFDGANGSTSFVDNAPTPATAFGTRGTIAQSTTTPLYGSASLLGAGSGSSLSVSHDPYIVLSTGDFTIEVSINLTNVSAGFLLYSKAIGSAATNYEVYQDSAGTIRFSATASDGTTPILALASTGVGVAANTLTHVAVTRSGSNFYLFLNGIQVATTSYSGALYSGSSTSLQIAGFYSIDHPELACIGELDEFRITKGVARYTSNFTVPTQPYPNF